MKVLSRITIAAVFSAQSVFAQPLLIPDEAPITDEELTNSSIVLLNEQLGSDYRTYDGAYNNLSDPAFGSVGVNLLRLAESDYGDDLSSMAGATLATPRIISNYVMDEDVFKENKRRASAFLWQWGQFVDHDMDLTPAAEPAEHAPIPVPLGDPLFDPFGTGTQTIAFDRSVYDLDSGIDSPREQINLLSAWIDGSNVYGNSEERADALRTLDGTGKLKTSPNNLLPFNVDGLENDQGPRSSADPAGFFVAGDIRSNEQLGLISIHTLFVREHNRLVDGFNAQGVFGDDAYQRARELVVALIQVVTYKEFLPLLLGKDNDLEPYTGYQDDVNPDIANEFSTVAFRFGHSTLNSTLLRLDAQGNEIPESNVALREAFFTPERIVNEGGIEPVLRGLAAQKAMNVDTRIVDDVRNFLFGPPGAGGFDLASLNIQRGRDHGLPGYNDVREAVGLPRIDDFSDLNVPNGIIRKLRMVYSDVDSIDAWVGGLAERHVQGGLVGELFHAIISDQFTRLRDGDRYWYQRILDPRVLRKVEKTRLSHIIVRNTDIERQELRRNVFKVRN